MLAQQAACQESSLHSSLSGKILESTKFRVATDEVPTFWLLDSDSGIQNTSNEYDYISVFRCLQF